jgi:hypothetical protein
METLNFAVRGEAKFHPVTCRDGTASGGGGDSGTYPQFL